jgi:hypothetical protein
MFGRLGLGFATEVSTALSLSIAAVYIVALSILLLRARRNYTRLPVLPVSPRHPALPDCMVVIPARNEEANIGRAVRSFPPDSVIVVDDASDDQTVHEAAKAGAGVLTAPKLSRGTVGKANACATGARPLTSRWILFVDADTWYEPEFLESAVAAAEASALDFVSFHLRFEGKSILERIVVPYSVALFWCGIDAKRDPASACNGQSLLVRREAYEFVGGHSGLMSYVIEDVKLALLAERHKMKLALVRTERLGHALLHSGWNGLWSGIERNALRFTAIGSMPGVLVFVVSTLAALWLPLALFLLAVNQPEAAAAVPVLLILLLRPWYPGWGSALTAPIAIFLLYPILLNAAAIASTGSSGEWKGREI